MGRRRWGDVNGAPALVGLCEPRASDEHGGCGRWSEERGTTAGGNLHEDEAPRAEEDDVDGE
jgi:hypothetical protein